MLLYATFLNSDTSHLGGELLRARGTGRHVDFTRSLREQTSFIPSSITPHLQDYREHDVDSCEDTEEWRVTLSGQPRSCQYILNHAVYCQRVPPLASLKRRPAISYEHTALPCILDRPFDTHCMRLQSSPLRQTQRVAHPSAPSGLKALLSANQTVGLQSSLHEALS